MIFLLCSTLYAKWVPGIPFLKCPQHKLAFMHISGVWGGGWLDKILKNPVRVTAPARQIGSLRPILKYGPRSRTRVRASQA